MLQPLSMKLNNFSISSASTWSLKKRWSGLSNLFVHYIILEPPVQIFQPLRIFHQVCNSSNVFFFTCSQPTSLAHYSLWPSEIFKQIQQIQLFAAALLFLSCFKVTLKPLILNHITLFFICYMLFWKNLISVFWWGALFDIH